jgi:hypothetical protein
MTAGCQIGSNAGDTTCAECAAMGSATGLDASISDEQSDMLTDMLRENDLDTSQVDLAGLQAISYCNTYGGAGINAKRPVKQHPRSTGLTNPSDMTGTTHFQEVDRML